MPLPTQALAKVQQYARAFLRTSFPGFAMGTRQFFGQSARAMGLNAWQAQKAIEDVDLDIVPSAQSTTNALAGWAFLLGLPNGAGGFGPFVPTPATGGIASLTGVQGTVYANGLIATAPDGATQIQVSGTVTIPGGTSGLGSVNGSFVALTTGSIGNAPIGTTYTWQAPPAGADPTFKLTSALTGGLDVETNAQVFARILQRLQNPPRGGTSQDYRTWAQLVSVISGVFVYGRRNGTGTVDIVITLTGSGIGRVPSNTQQTSAQAMVDQFRPVACDGANVLLPFTAATGHALRVRVVPNGSANAFDWGADVPGTAFLVDTGGYSAGPPATIRLTGLAPLSLKNAIQAYVNGTGAQPRLQALSTGSVVNLPIGTSKTITWSDAGGKTTITLDTVPSGWVAPSNGDTVYPYGPVVATIAAGELALINGLGPSRVSGYGDAFSLWQDTLSLGQMVRVAEDAVDASGNPLITEVLVNGATIDGSSAADLQAADSIPSVAPELLYAAQIAVTQ